MAGTVTTSGAVLIKAGTNASTDFDGGWALNSEYEAWIEEAEGYLCDLVKYDIVTNWASLNAVYKLIFTEYASSYAAIQAIKYDMSGYTSRIEAEDMINVLWARMQQIERLLKDEDAQSFIGV